MSKLWPCRWGEQDLNERYLTKLILHGVSMEIWSQRWLPANGILETRADCDTERLKFTTLHFGNAILNLNLKKKKLISATAEDKGTILPSKCNTKRIELYSNWIVYFRNHLNDKNSQNGFWVVVFNSEVNTSLSAELTHIPYHPVFSAPLKRIHLFQKEPKRRRIGSFCGKFQSWRLTVMAISPVSWLSVTLNFSVCDHSFSPCDTNFGSIKKNEQDEYTEVTLTAISRANLLYITLHQTIISVSKSGGPNYIRK